MSRIGLVVPYAADISPSGFYNRQEVGMAKALVELGHEVIVYKACRRSAAHSGRTLGPGIEERALPSLVLGTHGLFPPSLLRHDRVERFVVMSDVQAVVPTVFRWMARQGLPAFPYIGILQSHRGRSGLAYRWLLERNLKAYRGLRCYAKTPDVQSKLQEAGVLRSELLPVGLDFFELGKTGSLSRDEARRSFELPPEPPVLAYIGRLSEEKRPLHAVRIFQHLLALDPRWMFLAVGRGPLEQEFLDALAPQKETGKFVHIPKLPQDQMVRAYRASNVLINLCPTEIFGMTILESLYFGTPVVAVDAPGPRFIIREGLDGHVIQSEDPETLAKAVLQAYERRDAIAETSRAGVLERFDWKTNILRSGILHAEP